MINRPCINKPSNRYVLAAVVMVFCILPRPSFSQQFNQGFALHLLENKLDSEAISYFNRYVDDPLSGDTAGYMLANVYFAQKQMTGAYQYYLKISPEFTQYQEVILYSTIALCFIDSLTKADSVLNHFAATTSEELALKNCFKSYLALMAFDTAKYNLYNGSINATSYWFDDSRDYVQTHILPQVQVKKKSSWLAGLYSAAVPGLGKVYAGKPFDGLATFLQMGVIGAIATESLLNSGVNSARFIVSGGVYLVFYAGNIAGSTKAAKVKRVQVKNRVKHEIINNMHIILRNYIG